MIPAPAHGTHRGCPQRRRILDLLQCWVFGRHPGSVILTKSIEINKKKNKPKEQFVEGKQVCVRCEMVLKQAYLPIEEKRITTQ